MEVNIGKRSNEIPIRADEENKEELSISEWKEEERAMVKERRSKRLKKN